MDFLNWGMAGKEDLSAAPVLPAAAFISADEVSFKGYRERYRTPLLKYWLHITARNQLRKALYYLEQPYLPFHNFITDPLEREMTLGRHRSI